MACILLVDDEKIIRTLIRIALKRQDHEVLEACSARRAINLAGRRQGAIDLLLTELCLPGCNGLELADSLADKRGGMKIVFLSRFPHPAALEERACAANGTVVREPFEMKTLLSHIDEALQSSPESVNRKPPRRSANHPPKQRAQSKG